MPATFTRTPAETIPKEPGIGGKPPLDRRPTGGGGGGGDDDWNRKHPGPRERLYRLRFFVFSALIADLIFFAVRVAIFFARETEIHPNLRAIQPTGFWQRAPHLLLLNTVALLLGNLTIEVARRNIFREFDVLEEWLGLGRPALQRTLPWVAATLLFGGLFLNGQAMAWRQLAAQGFSLGHGATPASYFFYVLTGLHAVHLAIGMGALAICLCALGRFKRVEDRQIAVDLTAWYWHVMGLTWLFLLAVLAASQ